MASWSYKSVHKGISVQQYPTHQSHDPHTQDADDQYLEDLREEALTKKVIIIQRTVRGYFQRTRFKKMKKASVVIQKWVRRRQAYVRYKKVKYIKHCAHLVLIDVLIDEVRIRSLASYLEGKEINK